MNQPGEHTVSYRATDKAGNTSSRRRWRSGGRRRRTRTPPPPTATAEVSGKRNEHGAYIGAATVTSPRPTTSPGVDSVEFSLDGQPYAAYTAPVTVNQPGEHTVSYRATDVAGNTSEPQSVVVRRWSSRRPATPRRPR